jgi:hypothetical protein
MSLASEKREFVEPALRPPKFTLRTLWLSMTALCCLFAVMASLGALWSAVLVLFLCLVVAHVVGNKVGTQLRDHADRQILAERSTRPPRSAERVSLGVAAPEQLTSRRKLNRVTLLMAIGGALIGAELGGIGLTVIYPQASYGAMALGVFSSAVLGGFAGFLTGSFFSVIRQALAEAHRGAAATQLNSPVMLRPHTSDELSDASALSARH